MRRLLRRLLGSGVFWTRFWGAWTAVWTAAIPPSITVWRHSVPYLVFLSVMALVLSAASSWQASLAMRKADPHDPL